VRTPEREWTRRLTVRWADVDANGHMRNTAYSEFAADARIAFLAERGFTLHRLRELGIAPVVLAPSTGHPRRCECRWPDRRNRG
jgi:acyl-CoA thioester hydrolase